MKLVKLALPLVFCLITTLMLTGCETIARWFVEKPNVTLDHVGVKSVDTNGATVIFAVLVDNPNNFALKVDSVTYNAEISGHPVSAGTLDNLASVPAKSKSVVEIPIPVKFKDVFSSILDFVQKQSSTYHVTGEAKFGFITVPFDEKGELKLTP